ncbi:MAG: response regulator, partial [Bacteroidetes bacterium]|nr:response regulator [Bacteroidota bacterium]
MKVTKQALEIHPYKLFQLKVLYLHKGVQGLQKARDFKPDLILLDVMMPDVHGDQIAAELQADEALKKIPIVFLTGVLTKEEAAGQSTGAFGRYPFLTKPVSATHII